MRHIAHGDLTNKAKLEMVRDAAVEVRKPTMFGELIIMIVYLPILTLEGIEGKLFRPMALTVIFALVGSMVLSLTLMPVLASLLLPKKMAEREPLLMRAGAPHPRPDPAAVHAPQAVRDRLRPVRAGRRLRHDRPEPRLGVRAPAIRGGHRHQRGPAGGHRPGRVDPGQHADGKGHPRRTSPTKWSTSGAASEPPKSPPTRWAWNSDRRFHHAHATPAMEEGQHPGGTDRTHREGTTGHARPAERLHAAHRNADQRDDLRRADGRGREGLRG